MAQSTLFEPRAALDAVVRRFSEPEWLAEGRKKALDAYLESPAPDRVQHLWRYTDPAHFVPSEEALRVASFRQPAAMPATLHDLLVRGEISAAAWIDGPGPARIEVSEELKANGVRVLDLREALKVAPDLVRPRLGSLVGGTVSPEGFGKFEALNMALWSAGVFVHVPRKVRIAKPIHVWSSAPAPSGEAFFATRLLVVLEERCEATIIDECDGGGGTAPRDRLKVNSAVEVFVGQAAIARYASVQRLAKSVTYHVAERASVERDASLLTAIASLGGAVTKSDVGSDLNGPGANVELFGFLFGEGKQHFDHHTVHGHRAGKSYSNLDFKVVLKDRSRSAYTGLIRIEPNSPDSEAYQENRNLLLNEGARAESIPELEILTDEVKCTHGATVGTLDKQHIFYLMSRGIDRREAIRLIVGGFIEPTLSRLDADLRERLRAHVEDRLEDL